MDNSGNAGQAGQGSIQHQREIKVYATYFRVALAGLVISAASLGGCGSSESDGEKPATQVIAKVDSVEISVHQMNAVLARLPNINEKDLPQIKRDILNRLIDQQVAVSKAFEERLDRKPEVMMALEGAKREVLSRAYLQKLGDVLVQPTSEEVRAYYIAHPELFSERRVFNLQEIILQRDPDLLPALQDKVGSAKRMEEIAAWLQDRSIDFRTAGGIRAAEQLPMEALKKIHALKDKQISLLVSEDSYTVVNIAASRSQPVSESQALPAIQTFLTNQRRNEAILREMKILRDAAKIAYLGEFAVSTPATSSPAETSEAPPSPTLKPAD